MGEAAAVHRAELSSSSRKELAAILETGARVDNPVLSFAPLTAHSMRRLLEILVEDKGVDGVLVLLAPDPLADLESVVNELAAIAPASRKPIISCLMGDSVMRRLRHRLDEAGTPAFRTPETAANAFGILAAYHYSQTLSQQILPPEPLSRPPDEQRARALVREAQHQGRLELSPEEVLELLACFQIPVRLVDTEPEDAPAMSIRVHTDPMFG